MTVRIRPAAAAREVEEETGWRPRAVEFLLALQPAIGSADAPQDVYLAHGADLAGEPEEAEAEAEAVRWVPADEAHPTAGIFSCAHSVQLRACSNDLDGA
jgi:8-oxo-dGTP pyrophosphatase MutT (NUDIX family)